ncbi:type VI secretion system protein IglI family protein [Sorangium sp. So ce1000]|uniref:type VI secretion system protein IglI family protein n=1 Tax=Sorangium sp. So ce1000 TaxID=3133325 RepID=UPI003F5ED6FC
MARDLTVYLEPLDPQPEPGLDAAEPRLAEIVSFAEQGKYDAAADLAEELAGEGVHDIRALSFLLFAAFRESGLAALGEMFDVVLLALGPSFEAIGPAKRRKDHFNKRLAWLFETIVDALEYREKHGTSGYDALHEEPGPEALGAAIHSGERVAAELATDAYASAARALGRLMGFLHARAEALADEPSPSPASAAGQPSSAPGEDISPASPADPALPRDGAHAPVAAGGAARARIELAVAHPFLELLAKLRAFEVLVERGDIAKAAIVAEDVQQIIESFDPRAYFPEVFARFSALLSNNIGPLSEQLEERESLAWKARSQFYRVDLEGFIRS